MRPVRPPPAALQGRDQDTLLVAGASGLAFDSVNRLPVGTEAVLRVAAPAEAIAHVRDFRVRFDLDVHSFVAKPTAESAFRIMGHDQTSLPAARNSARLTATRAKRIL